MLTATDADQNTVGWKFDNTYARLPEAFFAPATPATLKEPRVTILNHGLAQELGLNLQALSPQQAAALFAGQNLSEPFQPIAQAYAGHQYGHFTMLGDGRAILLGEHRTPSGRLVDIQLKGAGRTRFSRGGDGRAALGPMLREYIISEAMAALGIPTTRSLAVVTTGEPVFRTSALKGAILTRVAASHIRVGTFAYLGARQDEENLRVLADYTIERHYPEPADAPQKYLKFLRAVIDRQAALIALWQQVGFIHGVMNTDNMAISGETIDYGPCAFMNTYDPRTVFSSIDQHGRYAYGNQPAIAQWNLARFAEALLPLIDPDEKQAIELATEVLHEFSTLFEQYWLNGMRKKLGLETAEPGDLALVQSLLDWMEQDQADFNSTFRDLSLDELPDRDLYREERFHAWHAEWQQRLTLNAGTVDSARAAMRTVNPAIIPRNHLVEAALAAAEQHDDLAPTHRLLEALATPFDAETELARTQTPPPVDNSYRTYCGT